MARKVSASVAMGRKLSVLQANLSGRQSADSKTLAEAYGLTVEHVKSILQTMGVQDDG